MTPAALLLMALVAVEVGLAAFGIRSGSTHSPMRLAVRSATFIAFVTLLLLGAFSWGPRYYATAIWLFAMTLGAAVTMALRRPRRTPRVRRVLLRAAAASIVTTIVVSPAMVFPEYSPVPPTGEHGVATSFSTLTDPTRVETYSDDKTPRRLNVGFWYPDVPDGSRPAETFPLVVFSHGGMGLRSGNESLFLDLASHGYVVASIDHPYHSLATTDEDGRTVWIDRGYVDQLRSEDAESDPEQSLSFYRQWMSIRMGDIGFVIDHLVAAAGRSSATGVDRLIDTGRIAVAGHSLGGSAALGVGRTRHDIDAVIALEAPFMADIREVSDGRFVWDAAPYPAPVLNIYSDSSWDHLDEWPQYARNQELLVAGTDRAPHIHINGVGHLGLTDLALASPFLTRLLDGQAPRDARAALRRINRACLEFLDEWLEPARE